MTPLGDHFASLLGAHGLTSRIGASQRSTIGGPSVLSRARSPFNAASSVSASVQRDVRAPYEPGRGQSR